MSDETPRVDALLKTAWSIQTLVDFARDLERELSRVQSAGKK